MTEATHELFSVDDVREHHVRIMQLINLPTLVPYLKSHNLLPPEDLVRVSDVKHHGTIERTGFLLHSLYKKDQPTINTFVRCLREEKDHPGHQEIIALLEKGVPDLPDCSPLFDILNSRMNDIVDMINITTFLNTLTNSGAIKVSSFLDLANPDRRIKENLERLLRILEEKGVTGFIDFLSCLRKDPTPSHENLFKILFKEVQIFFKEHPKREEVSGSDKIEILQLDTRGEVLEQEVLQRFKESLPRLEVEINIPILLPYLVKHHVLLEEEVEEVLEGEKEVESNHRLLSIIASKPPFWVVKFSECLKESREHTKLSELLLPPPTVTKDDGGSGIVHKNDKVVVMVHMGKYVEVDEIYQRQNYVIDDYISEKDPERAFRQDREDLLNHFSQLNFNIIEFNLDVNMGLSSKDECGGDDHKKNIQNRELRLAEKFNSEVVSKCSKDAIVFIYISGIQCPYKEPSPSASSKKFGGAVLLAGASRISRKETDFLKVQDILGWVEQLPTDYVTFLIDTEQNFVAKFGKQRVPELVEIVEDPWASLTDLNTFTVIYYLQPDSQAISCLRKEEDIRLSTGILTESFNFALLHCFLRNREGQEVNLCHRRFYEAISFYWHRKGRQHRAFVPAVRGDHSREFLGKLTFPYHQVFRVDMIKDPENIKFDMDKLSIRIGTMAKMILGDEMEIYHLLRPNVRVRGKISQSQPLNCMVEVERDEDREKLSRVVEDIYQNRALYSKDGSTEFLFAVKILPFHERVLVATEGLGEGDSIFIKSYIEKKSPQLLYNPRGTNSKVIVHKSGDSYSIEDKEGDVKHSVKVKRLSLILTFLEMIAWFKYVKKLKSGQTPPFSQYNCFLNAEKPLLHVASPLCEEFKIKWSSFDGVLQNSKGHEIILQQAATELQKFWTPSPPLEDPQPCLEIEFKGNYVITAIELKGDYRHEEECAKKADIYHQRDLFNSVLEGPSTDHLTKDVYFVHDEAVQFVTIKPLAMAMDDFSITFRMIHKILSGTKKIPREVDYLTVINWPFHSNVGTGWKFTPSPDADGNILLHGGYHWISWRGKSHDPVTFNLGMTGVKLEKIEFTSLTESNFLSKFELRLQTSWKKEGQPIEIDSVFPTKHEFPRPLVVSNIQLWPSVSDPTYNKVGIQLQLHGNKHDMPIDVERGDILSFHFNNFTTQPHFVCILCLEETGLVKYVMMDVAEQVYQVKEGDKSVSKFPTMKKLIQTYIPEGYNPEWPQISDIYKVFLCQHRMYLEPFLQQSLYHYHHPCSYTVCSFGRKEMKKGSWFDYTFEVVVKKSTVRK